MEQLGNVMQRCNVDRYISLWVSCTDSLGQSILERTAERFKPLSLGLNGTA
jgi:hypothetical protein